MRTTSEIRKEIERVRAMESTRDVYEEMDYFFYLADLSSELDDAERMDDILHHIINAERTGRVIAMEETYHGVSARITVLGATYYVTADKLYGTCYIGTDRETAARVYMELFDQILEEN